MVGHIDKRAQAPHVNLIRRSVAQSRETQPTQYLRSCLILQLQLKTQSHQPIIAIMVYDWGDKRDACFRMYVQEKKTMDEIIEYFRGELGFAPRSVIISPSRHPSTTAVTQTYHIPISRLLCPSLTLPCLVDAHFRHSSRSVVLIDACAVSFRDARVEVARSPHEWQASPSTTFTEMAFVSI